MTDKIRQFIEAEIYKEFGNDSKMRFEQTLETIEEMAALPEGSHKKALLDYIKNKKEKQEDKYRNNRQKLNLILGIYRQQEEEIERNFPSLYTKHNAYITEQLYINSHNNSEIAGFSDGNYGEWSLLTKKKEIMETPYDQQKKALLDYVQRNQDYWNDKFSNDKEKLELIERLFEEHKKRILNEFPN